jgi:hypothetical protein
MSARRALLLLVLAALLAAAAWWRPGRAPAPPEPGARPAAQAPPEAAPARPAGPPAPAAPEPALEAPLGLGSVDLGEVRAALPDNLYWQTAAPSDDPTLLEAREHEKAYRNELYGKILSGTGSDAEILEYYDYRARASTDYVQFVDYLLEHYGSDLSDQDQTLLHLARRLHLARLEEIPRRIQEARERKAQQDEARRAWLEQEQEFRGDAGAEP